MSITSLLIPAVIALAVTAKGGSDKKKRKKQMSEKFPSLETIFNDVSLLEETLRNRGLQVTRISDNQVMCKAGSVHLGYSRQNVEEPFWVTVSGVKDTDKLMSELECFEREYRENAQSYTYHKLMENLKDSNMRISDEEVLEDNSIMLTINV